MPYQFVPYQILLLLSALITAALGLYGYRHRAAPGTKAFVFGMFIGTLWSVANAMEISALTLEHKLFWANLQYIAYALAPVAWIIMVLQVSEKSHWVTKKNILLLLIIPAITFSLVWTDPLWGFVRHDIYLDLTGSLPVIAKKYSPWFWVHFTQAYFLNFYSLFLLLKTVFSKTTCYRTQALLLLIGTGMIAVVNLTYILGIRFTQYDLSPLVFSLSGSIIAWGIFRFQLFNLVPIARNKVIEAMQNIVIVIDAVDTVVDINPAAAGLFTIDKGQNLIGKPLHQLSEEIAEVVNQSELQVQHEFEFVSLPESSGRCYEMQISPIINNEGILMGNVIVMNDITELKQAQEELNREQREIAVMSERDRLAKDLHDNLGQIFSFAGIQIQAAQQQRQRGNQELADKYIERLGEIIEAAHSEMRDYVYNTHLDEYRKNSIENLILKEISIFIINSGYFSRKDIHLNLTDYEFPVDVKVHIVNIVKEALNNILKHACATSVTISLGGDDGCYQLVIEDNGIGFVRDRSHSKGTGSGLCIMEERARLLGGIMKIDSRLGKYTKTVIQFSDQ
ncbi:PAS domain-containing protein [Acetobacterium fimetarium]|uniref:histidine kinase n=1 Tax=Acetobacterium fimetarium TaxID=52691 RepID=A0ABR6WUM9_9FIRM|nr:histidine kinase N-terminal 7TM domain-containing protein [Acetobacterium fimetarium]MBC3804251.1 PAS domain-containing protein [Acetobacterium fimetarium]